VRFLRLTVFRTGVKLILCRSFEIDAQYLSISSPCLRYPDRPISSFNHRTTQTHYQKLRGEFGALGGDLDDEVVDFGLALLLELGEFEIECRSTDI
jgi:hypothetical protein